MQIFNSSEFGNLKELDKNMETGFGIFYILEYGEEIKIGSTKQPYCRLMALRRQCKYNNVNIGCIAVSPSHSNYKENEKLLHSRFAENRINDTELFHMKLEDVLSQIEKLEIDYSDEYEEPGGAFIDFVMDFVKGKYNDKFTNQAEGMERRKPQCIFR